MYKKIEKSHNKTPFFLKVGNQGRENLSKLPKMTQFTSAGPKFILGNLVPLSICFTIYSTMKKIFIKCYLNQGITIRININQVIISHTQVNLFVY